MGTAVQTAISPALKGGIIIIICRREKFDRLERLEMVKLDACAWRRLLCGFIGGKRLWCEVLRIGKGATTDLQTVNRKKD